MTSGLNEELVKHRRNKTAMQPKKESHIRKRSRLMKQVKVPEHSILGYPSYTCMSNSSHSTPKFTNFLTMPLVGTLLFCQDCSSLLDRRDPAQQTDIHCDICHTINKSIARTAGIGDFFSFFLFRCWKGCSEGC